MASHVSFVISGLLLVMMTMSIRSAPIEQAKTPVQWHSTDKKPLLSQTHRLVKSSTVATSTVASVSTSSLPAPANTRAKNDHKHKREIDENDAEHDDDRFYGLQSEDDDAESSERTLHAQMKESAGTTHDNADHPVNTDDSLVFSEVKMNPSELSTIRRRRRDVKANDQSNQRRKRALSSYDLYDTDGFYDPLIEVIERHPYVRPSRSFAPLYWYPPMYERNVRSALEADAFESVGWPLEYSNPLENDDDEDDSDESPVAIFDDGNNEDEENDYELNRYPILLESSKNPFDNLQLQQAYNNDDMPLDDNEEDPFSDDDDDDIEQYRFLYQKERPYYTNYGPFETYA